MESSRAFQRLLRHPRLAPYAFSAVPAWLWAADGLHMLWANAPGAELFGSARPAELAGCRFEPHHPAARELQRLRGTLPTSGAVQLARLRGFASGLTGILTCAAWRLSAPDAPAPGSILIVGTEPRRPVAPLAERARRMLGEPQDAMLFAPGGALLYGGTRLAPELAGRATLEALGAAALAAAALATGRAEGPSVLGPLSVEKLGGGDAVVLMAVSCDASGAARDDAGAQEGAGGSDAAAASRGAPREVAARAQSLSHLVAALDDAETRLVERRHPLRFVWRMDAEGRFSIEKGDFTALVGTRTTGLLGRPWREIAEALALDPLGQVLEAVAARDTWSSIVIEWPTQDGAIRLPVMLSGLPILSRDRSFSGYRGFGVCRDASAIVAAIADRRAAIARGNEAGQPTEQADIFSPPSARAGPPAPGPADESVISWDSPIVSWDAPDPPARPHLTVVPAARNVVPLRANVAIDKRPALSSVERHAFTEIARALGAKMEGGQTPAPSSSAPDRPASLDSAPAQPAEEPAAAGGSAKRSSGSALPLAEAVLDRLPLAVLAYRGEELLLANRAFLEWTGYADLDAVAAAGGLASLFTGPQPLPANASDRQARALGINAADGGILPVDVRLMALPANRGMVLLLTQRREQPDDAELVAARAQIRELRSVLDTATDGVLLIDADARILAGNLSAEALFGYEGEELAGRPLLDLFVPESQGGAMDYLEGLSRAGVAGLLNDGREVVGRVREGGLIPLFMTMGCIAEGPAKYCAVFRDLTQWKRAEEELRAAQRAAEHAAGAKTDFLAKISNELRTPLNTIIGFAELMIRERLGPLGNERYRAYLTDIHSSSSQAITLLDTLLDLSRIEAGRCDLTFTKVDLNDVMQHCVAATQPQANRERIIIRMALSPALPAVVADAPSMRQIAAALLANSIAFTGAGGQVIVSTALTDLGEVVLRVRDAGIGLSETQIAQALEPSLPPHADPAALPSAAGLGLPLAKALAEANHAKFQIKSGINAGTLVEIIFPSARVAAD